MVTLNETNSVARALNISETRLRSLVKRGVIKPTAKTDRGTLLFGDDDIERARRELELTDVRQ
jgi:DNA-binding transcriptional MerR regulator